MADEAPRDSDFFRGGSFSPPPKGGEEDGGDQPGWMRESFENAPATHYGDPFAPPAPAPAPPAQLPSAPEPVRSGQAVPPPPPPGKPSEKSGGGFFEPKKADAAVVDDGSGLTLNQQRALKSRMMGQGGAVARKTGGLAGPRLGLPPARPAPPSGPPPPSGPACGGNCAVS